MSTTEIGRAAESAACRYLESRGFQIIARNWRTRWHEIDIIAEHRDTLHFVEVKYRRSDAYGTGLEYISPDKIHRIRRAMLNWCQRYQIEPNCSIDAITITGTGPYRLQYEPNIE